MTSLTSLTLRALARPIPLALVLGFATAIPVIMAGVRSVQVPLGAVPADSLRLMAAPAAMFVHALAGFMFGLMGPLQFTRVLRGRFDRLHRAAGRVFVVAGVGLGLSGLALLARVESISTALLDATRGLAGAALVIALALGVLAVRRRDLVRHRAWMIRAYAIGMGSGTVGLVFFPIYLVNGAPPTGLYADLVFTGWWASNVVLAEVIVRQSQSHPRSRPAAGGSLRSAHEPITAPRRP
jgi:uncharacterized membrane protein